MKKLIVFLLMMFLTTPVFSADEWAKAKPAGSDNSSTIDNFVGVNNEAIDRLVSNYRQGSTLLYASAATITVEAGSVVCSNSAGTLRKFRTNTSSTTVAWTDIDTGSEATSTTYYVYDIADADSANFTCKISASATSPTGATYYKKIGSFYNNSSGDIEQITNDDSRVSIASGTIANGATIALPAGYSQDQCKWIVSFATFVGNGLDQHDTYIFNGTCTASSNRVVTVTNTRGSSSSATANYIIFGSK